VNKRYVGSIMGVNYGYGNSETKEFIDLGKSSIWHSFFYELRDNKLTTEYLALYLEENWTVIMNDKSDMSSEEYKQYVATHVAAFCERAGDNLLLKADDTYHTIKGEDGLCEDLEPPFFWFRPEWTEVWNRYIS
jgi:hypothetical protein